MHQRHAAAFRQRRRPGTQQGQHAAILVVGHPQRIHRVLAQVRTHLAGVPAPNASRVDRPGHAPLAVISRAVQQAALGHQPGNARLRQHIRTDHIPGLQEPPRRIVAIGPHRADEEVSRPALGGFRTRCHRISLSGRPAVRTRLPPLFPADAPSSIAVFTMDGRAACGAKPLAGRIFRGLGHLDVRQHRAILGVRIERGNAGGESLCVAGDKQSGFDCRRGHRLGVARFPCAGRGQRCCQQARDSECTRAHGHAFDPTTIIHDASPLLCSCLPCRAPAAPCMRAPTPSYLANIISSNTINPPRAACAAPTASAAIAATIA